MPKRFDTWKQDTPRMQVVALIGAALGDITNVKNGDAIDDRKALARAERFISEAQQIIKFWVPHGTWDQTVERS